MNKNVHRMSLEEVTALEKRDRRRLLLMVVGAVVIALSYILSRAKTTEYRDEEQQELAAAVPAKEPQGRIIVPKFDNLEVLGKARDARPEDRVLEDRAPLDALVDYARLLSKAHFRALGLTELSSTTIGTLEEDPNPYRAKAFLVRGALESFKSRQRDESRPKEFTGTLALEDGGFAHFVALELPEGAEQGQFVRLDGLFLKLYSSEGPSGFRDGPLFVARELVRSFPKTTVELGEVPRSLAGVEDDSTGAKKGEAFEAKWDLMALAAQDSSEHVDWDAAPELTNELLSAIFLDGTPHRGKPFRIPVSINLESSVEVAGENPLRLEKLTTGYIGNTTWKGAVKAFNYIAPFDRPELRHRQTTARYLVGRGYFLKNVLWESNQGQPIIAPLFVLDSIDSFTPDEDPRSELIMWGILGVTMVMVFLIWMLLMRDKQRSKELQAELLRRRRARREGNVPQPS